MFHVFRHNSPHHSHILHSIKILPYLAFHLHLFGLSQQQQQHIVSLPVKLQITTTMICVLYAENKDIGKRTARKPSTPYKKGNPNIIGKKWALIRFYTTPEKTSFKYHLTALENEVL